MQEKKISDMAIHLVYIVMLCAIIGGVLVLIVINRSYKTSINDIPRFVQVEQEGVLFDTEVIVLDSLQYKSKVAQFRDKNPIEKSNILFHHNPVFLIWSLLILFMAVIVSGGFPFFIGQSLQLIKKFELKAIEVLTAFGISALLVLLIFLLGRFTNGLYKPNQILGKFKILLNNGEIIIDSIVVGTFVLLIPAIMSVFLILPSSYKSLKDISEGGDIELAANRLNFLHNTLLNTLQFLAVVIVLAGLTTSLLGSSIKATIQLRAFDLFPAEISYAYGLYFTMFLGLIYLPVHFYITEQKNLLLERLSVEDENWTQKITQKLNTNNSALDTFKASLTVLAPFIASFLPEQLQNFS